MTIDTWITDAAARHPGKPAVVFDEAVTDYLSFADRIAARAEALRQVGVMRGDRVAWYGFNHIETFVLLFACARLGAILVPLNWRLAEAEIAAIVANCAPKAVLCDDHFAQAAGRLPGVLVRHWTDPLPVFGPATTDQGGWDDPVLLVYTSGSTGRPKGAVLTQAALRATAVMGVDCHAMTPDDQVLNALPLFHVGGMNILPVPAFSLGAIVHLHSRFEPVAMLRDLQKVTLSITVPTVLQAVLKAPGWAEADLTGLRALSIGSTDVPVPLIEAVHARGVPMVQIYGATETGPYAIYQRVYEAMGTVGSIGRVGSTCDIALMRPDGTEATLGEPGEIWVKGDNTLIQYWKDAEQTAQALQNGWFRTGDVARREADGLFWFHDRIKHVVISGGENIYPAEIERVLRQHPEIEEVTVVGQPDPKWGEIPVAVVVGAASLTLEAVQTFLQGQIARYKLPRRLVHLEALPRNPMGKVVAADVRGMIEAL